MPRSLPTGLSLQALENGHDLVLGAFKAWRRELDCIDALLLLVITCSNVDGILYSRELRARYGGPTPIAPNALRQPVCPDIVAHSLGIPRGTVVRRLKRLAEQNECVFTPSGMLITEDQVEATNRLQIVSSVYELLRTSYAQLKELGYFEQLPLPPFDVADQSASTIRPAAAHAAKYVLRLLSTIGRCSGDVVDGLIWLQLWCDEQECGALPARDAAAGLGLPYGTFVRRVGRLISEGFCERRAHGLIRAAAEPKWLAYLAESNAAHIFQLFAGLAEVGALADFETTGSAQR